LAGFSQNHLSIIKPSIHSSSVATVPFTLENPNIGSSEGSVAQRIADRVYRTVDVTQKVEKVPKSLRKYRVG